MRRWLAKLFLLLPFLLAIATAISYGEETSSLVIGPFGTLNNTDNSYVIPANKAQDLLNVDISPGGKSVKKRSGYGTAFTLSNATSPIKYVYSFFNSEGNSVYLFFNDRRMEASVSGGSPSVIFSTGSNGATYQCVDAAGYAYCSNDARTSIIKTDGLTDSPIITGVSTGTLLAITPERLVHAGYDDDPSRIDFSHANDFSTWTVGGDPEDPIQFIIVSPGAYITHITYAHGRVYWFKTNSFGYILEGPTHNDWEVRTLNSDIGTLFNTSLFRDDTLYFQGNDGHFYGWDGSNLEKLSRDIGGTIAQTQGRVENSWTQTSADDWNSSSFTSTNYMYVDTTTLLGSIRMTFPEEFDEYRNGSNSTLNVWGATQTSNCTSSFTVTSSQLRLDMVPSGGTATLFTKTANKINLPATGTTFYFRIDEIHENPSSSTDGFFDFVLNPADVSTVLSGSYFQIQFQNATSIGGYGCTTIRTNSGIIHNLPATGLSAPLDVLFYIDSTKYQVTINGVVISSMTHTYSNVPSYLYLQSRTTYTSNLKNFMGGSRIDAFGIYPETITFHSQINNSPDLTSWSSFESNYLSNSGNIDFFIRASTNQYTIGSSTPSWTAITPGNTPSISTGINVQVRADFSVNSSSSADSPQINDFTVNWFEGSASDKTHAIYHNDALWWAVASGAGASTNNKIIKLDLINDGYVLYDIPMNGMFVNNQNLYFGSPSAGEVFQFGTSDSDDGSAIDAYWKSRDFFGESPFFDKDFSKISFVAAGVANSSMTVTYTINGSSSTSYEVPISRGSDLFVKRNVYFPLGTAGSTIDFQFGNDAADQPFELFGAQLEYSDKPWNPEDD